jgi:hypothetical protein
MINAGGGAFVNYYGAFVRRDDLVQASLLPSSTKAD